MPEKDIVLWVGVLSALGAALVTTFLTHVFTSLREDRARRRETVSFLTSLDWEFQEAAMRIDAGNTTSPLVLPSLSSLVDRGLVGRLPVELLQEAFTVRTCLEAGSELVALVWKSGELSIRSGKVLPEEIGAGLRGDIADWFQMAAKRIPSARRAVAPFLALGWRGRLLRGVWRVIQ